jgi:F-type H+-transporting ATPase subunit a
MITNLFSVFDPSSSIFSTAWTLIFILPLIIRKKLWIIRNPTKQVILSILRNFKKEVSFTLNKKEKRTELIIITAFITILLINFLALYPQVFSVTSHLTVTLPLSLTFWLGIILFGWIKNTNHILSHLLPQGTPAVLISFMVIIELTRNIIRPITLCVRLTANLIAGHLLITLLGNALSNLGLLQNILATPISLTLSVLESAVACIQAYVFMTLVTLYTTETK